MSTLTDKLPALDLDEAKKPLFAAVGVIDLTVEQAKEIPATVQTEAKKLQAKVTEVVEARRAARTEQVKALPAQLKALPSKAQAKATELRSEVEARVTKAQAEATARYTTLTARGEKLVAQLRKQETTSAALAEGKAAVKKATTTAKKAAPKPAAKVEVEAPVVDETPAENVG
jgi:hypothetical protein